MRKYGMLFLNKGNQSGRYESLVYPVKKWVSSVVWRERVHKTEGSGLAWKMWTQSEKFMWYIKIYEFDIIKFKHNKDNRNSHHEKN